MEIFKSMSGYPDYEISNFGRVKTKQRLVRYTHAVTNKEHFRLTKERFLKQYDNNRTGYKFIQPRLYGKPSNETIHRLVALTFLDQTEGLTQVNHKDGNKHNNHVDNLEWCTISYNHQHATRTGLKANGSRIGTSKLNERCVLAIKKLFTMGWKDSEIAKLFDISRPTVNMIRNAKAWKIVALTGEELTN